MDGCQASREFRVIRARPGDDAVKGTPPGDIALRDRPGRIEAVETEPYPYQKMFKV